MSDWFRELLVRFLDYLEHCRLSEDSDLIAFVLRQIEKERSEEQ